MVCMYMTSGVHGFENMKIVLEYINIFFLLLISRRLKKMAMRLLRARKKIKKILTLVLKVKIPRVRRRRKVDAASS